MFEELHVKSSTFTLPGKDMICILDNLTEAQATKVQAALTSYFEDYRFTMPYEGNGTYRVNAIADFIIGDERADQMSFFAIGVTFGM